MNYINKILVAVELDKVSEGVIEYGITLGLMLNAELSYLHVSRPAANRIEHDAIGTLVNDYIEDKEDVLLDDIDEMKANDLEKLRAMVQSVLSRMSLDKQTIVANVKSDFAISGIITEADEIEADLIVLGAHLGYRMKDMAVGNLSKAIIDKASQSVVVVPSTYGNRNLDRMCMFINFEFGELSMIQDMMELASNNEVQISFVYVLDKDERVVDVEKKIKVYRRLFLHNEEHELISFTMKSGKIDHIINDLTNDMDVDFIGLKAQKRHWNLFGLQDTFENKVLNHFKVPLYVWKK